MILIVSITLGISAITYLESQIKQGDEIPTQHHYVRMIIGKTSFISNFIFN